MAETTVNLPQGLLKSPSFQLERLRRRTRTHVEAALSAKDFNLREYWVLTYLVDGDAASQAELGEIIGVDRSDMVRLVDALEKRGLAKREKDAKDRRRQIISVTKKGAKAQATLTPIVQLAEDSALDESTSKQLKHLKKLAKSIIAAEEDSEVDGIDDHRRD
ncbi:MAG TPA: MarR family transcriptional regulator [Candidatus Corynebacterium faecigallinarum]|uniref:MarR family transcriptional regulator n=1 Tax=Candidatus Corynebacterium faecigallinarum TaxID=2838528 RepID=A0A9D2TQM0_9CORY|nr:MarR family transcriptional regulator [Candidatus Corynebacterium faecigallinarum]